MKRTIAVLLGLAMLLGLTACTQEEPVLDVSGRYTLDEGRNEAVINDAGTVREANQGNNRVYYHIFVGSFSDSDGDGVGDLRGIIDRFDYLNDGDDNSGVSLGVEGIWLSPIFQSPSYHKYDVTDYYTIDPKFGTMEDLQELIDLCHERGVQIILDLVVNHTATSNQWFSAFRTAHQNGDTENPYYDFYSWSETNAPGAAWSTIAGSSHYYECNFSPTMPELNFDNPEVRQAMLDVAQYYLDMGVDGFRFDAAKYVYYEDHPRSGEFWDWYMGQLRTIKPDIYTVAEVWDSDSVTYSYIPYTNCFNFTMSQTTGKIATVAKGADVDGLSTYVDAYLDAIGALRSDAALVTFIANHDTDRAAGFLSVSSGQAKVAANLSVLMPGSTFVYYGEEIGMKGSRGGSSTDANRRLAMLWGDGDTVTDPEGADYSSEQVNGTVADQLPDGDSLYNHYKKLIALRKAYPAIAYGSYTPLILADSKAGGFLSEYEGTTVAVIHNTTTEEVIIDLSQLTEVSLTELAAWAGVNGASLEGSILTLGAQTSAILK